MKAALDHSAETIGARIDRLPSSRPVWAWLAGVSIGGFFQTYELALTSVTAPLLLLAGIFRRGRQGLFGLPDLATFAFALFSGLFFGVLLGSLISDRLGRRPVFRVALFGYAGATLAMAAQNSPAAICLWRFIAAVAVGAEIVAVDAYLAELMPRTLRGRGFALSAAVQFSAVPVVSILAAALAPMRPFGVEGWRLILLAPMAGVAMIWWARRLLPESPRWLAAKGRVAEGERIVGAVEDAVRRRGHTLPEAPRAIVTRASQGYLDLFRKPLRRRVVMMIVASCSSSIAFYGFYNWLPSLLEQRGAPIARSLLYTAVVALAYPLTPLCLAPFADRVERKWQIAMGSAVVVAAGLAFAVQTRELGWVACGLLVSAANNLVAFASHTYRSELFPTGLRARAIGLIYGCDRLVAAFSSYAVAAILVSVGVGGVLVFITAAALLVMAAVGLFGPRTRLLASEDIPNAR